MIVAMHLILFSLGRVIGHHMSVDFRQSLVMGSRTSIAVAIAVAVRPARSRLVAVVIVIIIVVSVAVHLRKSRLGLPTV